jgi:hypothetical protein
MKPRGNCSDNTTIMRLRVCFVSLAFVTIAAIALLGQKTTDLRLEAGSFRYIRGSELGKPLSFENEIDATTCFSLMFAGRVIGWLARAYDVNGRLLGKRCIEFDPSQASTGSRHGGENESWEELRLGPDGDLLTSRLRLPHETIFSNGSFCSELFAYWGYSIDDELITVMYDLRASSVRASRSLGKINLETDDSAFLPTPQWNDACSEAVFDATVVNQPTVTLGTRRSLR